MNVPQNAPIQSHTKAAGLVM